jgi:hypothetical protein
MGFARGANPMSRESQEVAIGRWYCWETAGEALGAVVPTSIE